MPPRLGAHMSIAGGLDRAVERAVGAGCAALQVFTRNSNQWAARPLEPGACDVFRGKVKDAGLDPVLAHTSYLINVGTADDALWRRSVDALEMEVARAALLGIPYLVMHPGAHVGAGEEAGLDRIAHALDEVHRRRDRAVTILLENTAGQGTCLGHTFEQIAGLIDRLEDPGRVGVCLDTAHTFAAGYDIATDEGWEATWRAADRAFGWSRVRALHVNDSKKACGSRVDRHEQIGLGLLGPAAFWRLMNDPRFDGLVGSLETEKEDDCVADEQNLLVLRRMAGSGAPPTLEELHAWRAEALALFRARQPAAPRVPLMAAKSSKVTKAAKASATKSAKKKATAARTATKTSSKKRTR